MKTFHYIIATLTALLVLTACTNENMAQQPQYANGQQVNNSYSNQQQMNSQQQPGNGNFVRMTDPKENAFSVMMPKGWQAQVSLERPQEDAVRPCGMAMSPDGASRIFFGDPGLPTFLTPNSQVAAIAQMSKMYAVSNLMTAEQFARDYIQRVYGQQSSPQISQVRPDQELLQIMRGRIAASGFNPQIDVAVATFTFNYQGAQVKGELNAIVAGMQDFWVADVAGFTSTANNTSNLSGMLRTVVRSYETNPQWQQQQQQKHQQTMANSQANHQQRMQNMQNSFNAHQQRMQSNQQAFDAHNQSWNQQQQINDQSHQNWMNQQNRSDQSQQQFLNYIKDENTVTNGGYESQVQSGYNYYWMDQTTGTYIGTNTADNPDPSKYQLWKKK
jgi:hypothetical protein